MSVNAIGGVNPQLLQARQQLRTDLLSAGIDRRAIAQQVAAQNGGVPDPQLMHQALNNAISQISDPSLKAKVQQDQAEVKALRPPPDPQLVQARQQFKTDLLAAGIDRRAIAQQVTAQNGGQFNPQLVQQAVTTAIAQVSDPAAKAQLQQDQATLQALKPQALRQPQAPQGIGLGTPGTPGVGLNLIG